MACPIRALLVPYRMLSTFTSYEMINVMDTFSPFVHIPSMFPSTDILFDCRIWQVTTDQI